MRALLRANYFTFLPPKNLTLFVTFDARAATDSSKRLHQLSTTDSTLLHQLSTTDSTRAVASLTVPRGKSSTFLTFFSNFDQFFLFFLKLYLFFSSIWPSDGRVAHPGRAWLRHWLAHDFINYLPLIALTHHFVQFLPLHQRLFLPLIAQSSST